MVNKYDPKKHHRRSIRLPKYDYSSEGMYFVTMNVAEHECLLGEISGNQMRLSTIGQVVKDCWEEIPEHFPNVSLGEYVVMPNHVHGIILIEDRATPRKGFIHETHPRKGENDDLVRVEYIQPQRGKPGEIQPQRGYQRRVRYQHIVPGSLSSIVRCFKAAVTRKCRASIRPSFGWQRDYYEHVIRDGEDLDRIREYILENPANWRGDENFPGNIRMDPVHRGSTP